VIAIGACRRVNVGLRLQASPEGFGADVNVVISFLVLWLQGMHTSTRFVYSNMYVSLTMWHAMSFVASQCEQNVPGRVVGC